MKPLSRIHLFISFTELITLCALFTTIINNSISTYDVYCYSKTSDLPHNKVGLVLGTNKRVKNGNLNYYYYYRINAAEQLYKSKKVDYLLISGDNSRKTYNEPEMFRQDLIQRGIPDDKIVLDFAGFRTLDSIIRCKEVFNQSSVTVVSQQFHNERALFIAKHKGLKAVAFNAKDIKTRKGLIIQFREKLARVNAFLDVFILRTSPKFLGKKITIG